MTLFLTRLCPNIAILFFVLILCGCDDNPTPPAGSGATPSAYLWSNESEINALWTATPPREGGWTRLKPGDSFSFASIASDYDKLTNTVTGIITVDPDTVRTPEYGVETVIGSTIDREDGDYVAGNTRPPAGGGIDIVRVTYDDLPKAMLPKGSGGTRDDDAKTLSFGNIAVYFPFQIVLTNWGSPVNGNDRAWTQVTTWQVQDQWGNGLQGVALTENPVIACTPFHPSESHLDGYVHTGSATSGANGLFTDTFGVAAGLPVLKTLSFTQTYGVTFGTYTNPNALTWNGKINHWRPVNPSLLLNPATLDCKVP